MTSTINQGILWAVLTEPLPIEPIYPNGKPHHITLIYGATESVWKPWIGQEFLAYPFRSVNNDRIQAVEVALPDAVPCKNAYPHITVSWINDALPVESNQLLSERRATPGYQEQFLTGFAPIKCRIEFLGWEAKPP